ncbi:MAG TPA: NAD-dependent epimerase/dehydratase family protein [Phycicoccus sp.]|nr:NAD-dependent epimerase/dehydratase family protein [Phycicoccus sp.]
MSRSPIAWVVGSGGLVGRHVAAGLEATGHDVLTSRVPWDDEDSATARLAAEVERFERLRSGRPWTLAWCAGAGVVSTPAEALAAEERVFAATLGRLAAGTTDGASGVVFLASSAGGLYAGSSDPPFSEATPPRPLVPYGRTKLAMEEHVRRLAPPTGWRAVLGRLANVYGPGQTLGKPQGLLSQLCLADATGQPLPVFVSMDTLRDYVFVEDAARMVVRSVELARSESPGSVVPKVIASGTPVTVGHLIGEARRVFHRPLRTIPLPGGAGQVLDLRLRSVRWTELDALARTTLAAGLSATAADVRSRVVAGGPLDG